MHRTSLIVLLPGAIQGSGMNVAHLPLHEQAGLLRNKKVSSHELVMQYMQAVEKYDSKLNSYLTKNFDQALIEAKKIDAAGISEQSPPLCGIPIALKDNFLTKGLKTTCASRILANYIPPYDGTAVAKLKGAGAIITGKLNMDEFAMGSSNEYSAFGPAKNPWDEARTPGGSSGGSAVAVCAGLCSASLGTDTGGSVRLPASFCNLVAIKPTYGRVSRYGIVAFASSLDQIGPITRDVTDAAIMLRTIAGFDKNDSTSLPNDVPDYSKALGKSIKGMKIGVPGEYASDDLEACVKKSVQNAIDVFKALGAQIVPVGLPHTKYAIATYYIIAPAEASANLARFDGVRYGFRASNINDLDDLYEQTRSQGFGPEVSLRIMVGTYVLSAGFYDAYYEKAQKVRTLIRSDFSKAFEKCDFILGPVSPTTPFKLGEKMNDPIKMYLSDLFTIPANMAGLPAIALPAGFSDDHLPIGIQLTGKHLDEEKLFSAAYAFEQETDFHKMRPDYGK